MAFKITEDCISCGACEPDCPNQGSALRDDEEGYDPVEYVFGARADAMTSFQDELSRVGDVVVGAIEVITGVVEVVVGTASIMTGHPLAVTFGMGAVSTGGDQIASGVSRIAGWGPWNVTSCRASICPSRIASVCAEASALSASRWRTMNRTIRVAGGTRASRRSASSPAAKLS